MHSLQLKQARTDFIKTSCTFRERGGHDEEGLNTLRIIQDFSWAKQTFVCWSDQLFRHLLGHVVEHGPIHKLDHDLVTSPFFFEKEGVSNDLAADSPITTHQSGS